MFSGILASSFVVRTAHDWFVEVGEWQFGIHEGYCVGRDGQQFPSSTEIYVGPTSFGTSLSAYAVLAVLVVISALAVSVFALLVARFGRKRDAIE